MKIENKKLKIAGGAIAFALLLSSCDNLQDSLSSEQLIDQKEGIGSLSAESTTYYYNGTESDSVKGSEAHIALRLNQIANADNASVKYTLSYSMDDIDYTSSGSGSGTLSDSKSKYYVDLSPAINLLDGTKKPAYTDISYEITVSGLVNKSGNDYDGWSIPSFTKKIKFAPLYADFEKDFSTKSAPAGTTFTIPLNAEISAVDEAVTATATEGNLPETTFTASVGDDGKSIVLTTSANISGEEFTAKIKCTGIKIDGQKESFEYEFADLKFVGLEKILLSNESLTITEEEGTYQLAVSYDLIKDCSKVYITFAAITAWGSGTWDKPCLGTDSSTWKSDTAWVEAGAFSDANVESETGGYEVIVKPEDYTGGIYISGKTGLSGTLFVTGCK
ncbi:MAG: hypothetical protein IKN34_06695 [Treponema sp.]|nr:hypothetical protein [Treponema sp.]